MLEFNGARVGSNSADFGTHSPKFGRFRPQSGQSLPQAVGFQVQTRRSVSGSPPVARFQTSLLATLFVPSRRPCSGHLANAPKSQCQHRPRSADARFCLTTRGAGALGEVPSWQLRRRCAASLPGAIVPMDLECASRAARGHPANALCAGRATSSYNERPWLRRCSNSSQVPPPPHTGAQQIAQRAGPLARGAARATPRAGINLRRARGCRGKSPKRRDWDRLPTQPHPCKGHFAR